MSGRAGLVAKLIALLLGLRGIGPSPVVAPPAPPPAPVAVAQPGAPADPLLATWRLCALHNAERSRAGLAPLAISGPLSRVSMRFAAELAARDVLTHGRLSGVPFDREIAGAVGAGVECGENAAEGQGSEAEAVAGWMASPGHRDNILNPAFDSFGAGVAAAADGTPFWVCDFARLGRAPP